MKKLSLYSIIVCATAISTLQAQNPFASIGKKSKPMLTLSNGRYEEFFENDSIRQVGSVMVNMRTEKIVAFVDRKEQANKLHSQSTSRFLSLDPLARNFPWNSPYSYAENDVIRCIDLDGLEKVAVFGGADLQNTGLAETTIQTAEDIQKFSDNNKLGYEVKTFNVAPWNPSQGTAFNWIKDNYKEGESIIIYGYSMGGVAATQLAKLLKTENITVNLLVAVDAAWGPFGKPLNVPDNVETMVNYYQTNSSSIFSHGYPAKAQEGNDNTILLNYNMTDKTSGKKGAAHGTMDEDTKKPATNFIKTEMIGKLDGIIEKAIGPKKEDGTF